MSLEASEASLAAVLKQCPSSHSSASGFRSARTYRKKSRSLPEDFIHESEKNILSRYQQPNSEARYQSRLQLLEQLLQEACDHGIAIELIIPPLHQRIHNIHDTLNLQNDIQRWKDHLFSAAKKRRDAGCSVNMTDFSELNEITQSRLTLKNERADDSSNPWFYEPSHFTPTTGKCILASLRGNKKACTKQAFGTTRL
jgi:hypothetical protein